MDSTGKDSTLFWQTNIRGGEVPDALQWRGRRIDEFCGKAVAALGMRENISVR